MSSVSRRQALQRVGKAAAVAGAAAVGGRLLWDRGGYRPALAAGKVQVRDFRVPSGDDAVELAIAQDAGADGSAASKVELVSKALDAMGSMKRFVAAGDVVAIKPNIGWDRTPAQAANTHPSVVGELVRQALAAGASKVVVSDVSCNDPARAFQRSGIWKAAHEAGAHVLKPAQHHFRSLRLGGDVLDEWPIFAPLVDADKVINVPIVKHHTLARFTCALKNWYGLLGGRRNRLHQNIDLSIADLATFMQPTLTVVDGTRVLVRNGPQGGNLADTRDAHTIIASTDQVAADAYACTLIDLAPSQVGYLQIAAERGLGTIDWSGLRKVEV